MSMELKTCREALKSGNKPAADELLCVKAFSMEQVKAIEEKDGRIICDFILSNGAVDRDFDIVNPDRLGAGKLPQKSCCIVDARYVGAACGEVFAGESGGQENLLAGLSLPVRMKMIMVIWLGKCISWAFCTRSAAVSVVSNGKDRGREPALWD